MKILILGSGGRECALAWKISQSNLCDQLFIAPGNGGTHEYGTNVRLSPSDFEATGNFCLQNNIELVVVGPEDPLVAGIIDYFRSHPRFEKIKIIGPDKHAAQLEGSKKFAKEFMVRYGIPTAAYQSFQSDSIDSAKLYLKSLQPPYVIKADGLAAGKGVLICSSVEEAESVLDKMLINQTFGIAGSTVVIEEFLQGIEMSVFVMTDGQSFVMLPEAKDYKRIGDNDTGLNTGGMGTISPVPFADHEFMMKVKSRVIEPTIEGIRKEKMHYCGFIFFGLMNVGGNPYVIEYNVRLGDPETQSILPRIDADLVELLLAASDKSLAGKEISISDMHVVNVVLASGGYPGSYEKGKVIRLPSPEPNNLIFHAGTALEYETLLTSGGRVLSVCGMGNGLPQAIENAYIHARKIHFENKYMRTDIGKDVLGYSI
jgi:phosphoribosylamine---glycine ligase